MRGSHGTDIVAGMRAAYRRLPRPFAGEGVFIAGPSKTADVEQALLIGALGPMRPRVPPV